MTNKEQVQLIANELATNEEISKERMRQLARMLVETDKFYYFHRVKEDKKLKRMLDFIMCETSFIDYDASMNARFWYVIHNKTELMRCHNPACNKVIRRHSMKPLDDNIAWYCCDKCVTQDPYYREKISSGKKNSPATSVKSSRKDVPPPRKIEYHDAPISYDDQMNKMLAALYEDHKKTFRFWLDKNESLKMYLYEKSYPIDFTDLNIETRVYWVLHKLQ